MRCTVYIPHLISPRESAHPGLPAVRAPHLEMLLARAEYTHSAGSDPGALLCQAFGIARQQDSPLAPILAWHHGLAAHSNYWLCATPAHLDAQRNALVLPDPARLDITAAESYALVATLAEHLRAENISMHAPQPGLWFLCCATPPRMTTSALDTVIGRDVRTFLPQGKDALRWHRILTEIQMLLHAHPVNEVRESRGKLSVNSVWLWGGGTLPASNPAIYTAAYSDEDTICALAHHAGCTVKPAAEHIALRAEVTGNHFFSTQLLTRTLRNGDVQAWSDAVTMLDRNWFQPLISTLKSRQLECLHIISPNSAESHQFLLSPWDLWKLWRKNRYLE